MRIIIEIEDGAVRATHVHGTEQREAANAGGPPAELLQLLAARPALATGASKTGAAVNVGGPPEDLLAALGAPRRP
jgi:hypothetical protein